MSDNIPDRVDQDLRRHYRDQERTELLPSEIAEARREIIEEVVAGERVSRSLDLEAIIEAELDRNYAATVRSLYEHFAGIGSCADSAGKCLSGDEWMTRLVAAAVSEDCEEVEERALANREDA